MTVESVRKDAATVCFGIRAVHKYDIEWLSSGDALLEYEKTAIIYLSFSTRFSGEMILCIAPLMKIWLQKHHLVIQFLENTMLSHQHVQLCRVWLNNLDKCAKWHAGNVYKMGWRVAFVFSTFHGLVGVPPNKLSKKKQQQSSGVGKRKWRWVNIPVVIFTTGIYTTAIFLQPSSGAVGTIYPSILSFTQLKCLGILNRDV